MGERRYYKAHKDNCMQCCLCYLLDVDLQDVLDVAQLPTQCQKEWFNFLNEYLLAKYEKILAPLAEGHMPEEEGIAIVQSIGGKGTHSVVIDKDDNILWDPNPESPVYGETLVRLVLL